MIRSAAFFILSLALHATALVYPVSFRGTGQFETIQIEILSMDQEAGGAGAQGGSGDPASRSDSRSNRTTPPPIESRAGSKSSDRSDSQALPAEALPQFSDRSPTSVSAIENSPEANGIIMSESAGNHLQSYSAGGVETVNGGSASAASGTGPGSGNGSGSGSSGSVITVSQARYLDTPKPSYPEIARREGREGRVLLRVLVDDQGRTKTVEINSSSGNEALDRAAAEAVKRWHFQPARYDDRAVESWLRIPIEFRLADAKSW
jgi:TonB family protein